MRKKAFEWNFDGLVGPTHNYAGLSVGNVASQKNANQVAYPRDAALQGLAKMKALADMGYKQGVIPPQLRPDLEMIKRLGFSGNDEAMLASAAARAPHLLAACFSASSMWTANAATVSPSADSADGRVHFTPANLVSKFHRSIEAETTGKILRAIFRDETYFCHHPALPQVPQLGDEGAANHTRFCQQYGDQGFEFFVYGRKEFDESQPRSKKFPARQTLEASEAVVRHHGLDPHHVVYAQQNPEVIDEGVFHNDVISVGNKDVLFMHELSFLDSENVLAELKRKMPWLRIIIVPNSKVSVLDAVQSYLFNSQLLEGEGQDMRLICPEECRENQRVAAYLKDLTSTGQGISDVVFRDVKQSMQNGGGPACLRLRVVLTDDEVQALNPRAILTDALYRDLTSWVKKHYREELSLKDFTDWALTEESYQALRELEQLMDLGSVYPLEQLVGLTE